MSDQAMQKSQRVWRQLHLSLRAASLLLFLDARFGRPEIANGNGEGCGLSFNISHTRGLIAVGVTQRRELGVDVENVSTRQASIGIADRFFPPTESQSCPVCRRTGDRTGSSSTGRSRSHTSSRAGMGLSIPLEQFSFHYPHERAVSLAIRPKLGDAASRWCFWQFRRTPEHLLVV